MAELGGASVLPGPAVVVAVDFAELIDAVAGFHEVVGRVDADDGGGIDDAIGEVGVSEDSAGEPALGLQLAKVRRGNAVDDSPVLNFCLRFVHVCAPFLCPVANLSAQRLSLVKMQFEYHALLTKINGLDGWEAAVQCNFYRLGRLCGGFRRWESEAGQERTRFARESTSAKPGRNRHPKRGGSGVWSTTGSIFDRMGD